jgi:hypothetical protein
MGQEKCFLEGPIWIGLMNFLGHQVGLLFGIGFESHVTIQNKKSNNHQK